MKYLFSPEGEAALKVTMAKGPLLAFDFDGTLAPIVTRPDDARIPEGVARRLTALAKQLPVAIISGRAIDDLKSRLSFEPHYLVGNHGAEDPSDPVTPPWAEALTQFRGVLAQRQAEFAAAGIEVEDKRLSLALHYRNAKDHDAAVRLVTQALSGVDQRLAVFGGKMVANVVAAQAPDKAHTVARLVARCKVSCAVFAGDDVNDEPVFARPEPSWLTVRVGHSYPNSMAKYFVENTQEIELMLDRMCVLLGLPPG